MHRSTQYWLALGLSSILAAGIAAAQTPDKPATPGPPKPGPEHARLATFLGTWKGQADVKEGPMGPGGKLTWTETCDWFDGGFQLVCKSSGIFPSGKRSGMSIFGYDPESGAYTHFNIDSTGGFDIAVGSVSEEGWVFGSERPVGDDIVRARYMVQEVTPTSKKFTFEMQKEGGAWTLVMSGSSEKAK